MERGGHEGGGLGGSVAEHDPLIAGPAVGLHFVRNLERLRGEEGGEFKLAPMELVVLAADIAHNRAHERLHLLLLEAGAEVVEAVTRRRG